MTWRLRKKDVKLRLKCICVCLSIVSGASAERFVSAIQFFVKINTKHADILSEDLNAFQRTFQGQLAKFVGLADKKNYFE